MLSPAQKKRKQAYLDAENSLIAKLYDSILEEDFFVSFIQQLCPLIDASSATLVIADSQSQEIKGGWSCNVDLEYLGIYIENNLVGQDLLVEKALTAQPGKFYATNLHIDDVEHYQGQSELYQIWAKPQGIHDVAGALLRREGSIVTFIAIQRQLEQGPYQPWECDLLARLIPHLNNAITLHQQLTQLQNKNQPLQELLSLIKIPTLVFDEHFDISFSNKRASKYINDSPGIDVKSKRLVFNSTDLNNEFNFRIMEAVKASIGQFKWSSARGVFQINTTELPSLTFVLLPLKGGPKDNRNSGAIAFIYDTSNKQTLLSAQTIASFGFSPAESELCSKLIQGFSLDQAAEALGKNRETVRSQLKSLFRKTASNSQDGLITTVLSNPTYLLP